MHEETIDRRLDPALPPPRGERVGARHGRSVVLPALLRKRRRPRESEFEIPEGAPSGAALRRDARYRRLLAGADLVSTAAGVFVAIELVGTRDGITPAILLLSLFVVILCKTFGLYDRDGYLLHKTTLEEAPAILQVSALVTLLMVLGEGFFVTGELGNDQTVGLFGTLIATMLVGRSLARRVARATTQPERCLVLGNADDAQRLAQRLAVSHVVEAEVVGRVGLERERPGGKARSLPVFGSLDTLGLTLVEEDVDRVVIAPESSDSEHILDAIRLSRSLGVRVSVIPRLFEIVGSSVEFDQVGGAMLLGLRSDGFTKSSRLVKRALDLVGSLVGLVVLGPLLVGIAIAVRLDSPGPALFRQRRIGRDGVEFEMVKFRTMVRDAELRKHDLAHRNESEGLFKIADDPRLTRLGRLLRPASLDELPQLVNILRGEMSLVGPRPLVPDEDCRVHGWGRRRLRVSPGMTGVWQLFGPSQVPLNEMVKMDYVYGANWSLWLDVKILLRTFAHAFGRRGI